MPLLGMANLKKAQVVLDRQHAGHLIEEKTKHSEISPSTHDRWTTP
jgi:hypothetical protein